VNKLFLLSLLVLGPFTILGQDGIHTSTLTLGVGGMPYSYNSNPPKGGPTFSGLYEYRGWKYLAVEGGVDTLLPSVEYSRFLSVLSPGQNLITAGPGCPACVLVPISERSRITLLTFGFKGILPLARNRVELFGGFGGAHAWNSEFGGRLNGLMGQASLGGRVALDRDHHFWLGTTLRGYTNFGSGRQAWVPLTIDLGIRFGH